MPFGNIRFSSSVSGFGISGVASGQFEFDVYDKYGIYSEAILEGSSARLTELNDAVLPSRVYYLSKRSVSKKICHFVAYDVLSQVDKQFDTTALSIFAEDDEIPLANILSEIGTQCGIDDLYASADGFDCIHFSWEQIQNRTCRNVLEMLATAMCGVWVCDYYGGAVLSCYGQPWDTTAITPYTTQYTEIDYQGKQQITKIIFTNTDTGEVNVLTNNAYGVGIEIESPFVACGSGLDELVWERVQGYEYQAWHCEKALVQHALVPASGFVAFGGTDLRLMANSSSLSVDSTGVYFTGGLEPQNEWNYDNMLEREKIAVEKSIGNAVIRKSGRYAFRNLNK